MLCPPKRTSARPPWPKPWRRWLAGKRQIVETAFDKLLHTFRLDRERPHALDGLQARLAAKMVLHNFCLWLNAQLGRPRLAFADLVDRGGPRLPDSRISLVRPEEEDGPDDGKAEAVLGRVQGEGRP